MERLENFTDTSSLCLHDLVNPNTTAAHVAAVAFANNSNSLSIATSEHSLSSPLHHTVSLHQENLTGLGPPSVLGGHHHNHNHHHHHHHHHMHHDPHHHTVPCPTTLIHTEPLEKLKRG